MTDVPRPRDPQGPNTASRQIADSLWTAIQSGELPSGAKLPSERQLVQQFNVARNTARAAVRYLIDAGLVTAEHGRGVFVLKHMPDRRLCLGLDQYTAASDELFQAEVSRLGATAELVDLGVDRVMPPADVAERLRVRAGRKSVVRRRSTSVVGLARLQYEVTYLPWEIAKGTDLGRPGALWPGERYELLEQRGYRPARVQEEIRARMPTPAEAVELQLPDGVALLELRHTGIDASDRVFEVTERVMRGDSVLLDYCAPVRNRSDWTTDK